MAGNVSGQSQFWLLKHKLPIIVLKWLLVCPLQEVAVATKEEEEDLSDKGSESEEAEGNKDSPSERDEESDKQSDTEVDEIAGDDEEVCVVCVPL